MKTLNRILWTFTLVGLFMLGTSSADAQQRITPNHMVSKSAVLTMSQPVIFSHPDGDIEVNPTDFPLPTISAGNDISACSDGPIALSGVNATKASTYWETSGDGLFNDPFKLDAVYTPGSYDIQVGQVTLSLIVIGSYDIDPLVGGDSIDLFLKNCGENQNENPIE